jgi:hypothetical protein
MLGYSHRLQKERGAPVANFEPTVTPHIVVDGETLRWASDAPERSRAEETYLVAVYGLCFCGRPRDGVIIKRAGSFQSCLVCIGDASHTQ